MSSFSRILLAAVIAYTQKREVLTGVMLGLGEERLEVHQVMDDMRSADIDFLTMGQYLQPSRFHLPIQRYYTPDEFARLKEEGEVRGFRWVESGPLVRSSYHADQQAHVAGVLDGAVA